MPRYYIHETGTGLRQYTPEEEAIADAEKAQSIIDKKEYDALAWKRSRVENYPSIQDVTVALAEKAEGDSTMWDDITAKRAKVKADHPKP